MLQKDLNQVLLKLAGEMYKVKQIEARLKERAENAAELWKKFFDVANKRVEELEVKNHLLNEKL